MSTSKPLLDFELLLSPISPESPCGESLQWDPQFDELKQMRKSRKDPLDPSGDKEPDWGGLIALSTQLLAKRTKDLLIAGWLTEALLRTSSFAGLRDGLRLIRGFVDKFWDGLYPQPDEEDFANRAAPLLWLTQTDGGAKLPALLREISLTSASPRSDEPLINWNLWHQRRAPPQASGEKDDVYKRRVADAEKNRQTFDAAVETAPLTFYQTLLNDIDACLAEIDTLSPILDGKLGADLSPSWGKVRDSIGEIRGFVIDVLKRRGGLPADTSAVSSTETSVEEEIVAAPTGHPEVNRGRISSRADAMSRLEEAADFFSKTEPHSPVAYLVRRAIRWAGMPFEEVLGELVKDDKLVKQISETLGIVSGPTK
ncbi:type VI secretion system protein TssA [Schlesneria paludicola]|uniref:type VI secretion system protein TssA n=1 Tax=Schlesneria paludicola TaxID=360056 RepID=UPI00029AB185|nr:type VI secretion system protein TssA [Schlesneria paludicola]